MIDKIYEFIKGSNMTFFVEIALLVTAWRLSSIGASMLDTFDYTSVHDWINYEATIIPAWIAVVAFCMMLVRDFLKVIKDEKYI